MKNLGIVALDNVLRYLEDELQKKTKFVAGRSLTGCSIREEPKTAEDFAKLQKKLDDVRQQLLNLDKNGTGRQTQSETEHRGAPQTLQVAKQS
jgi:hypothetical protein